MPYFNENPLDKLVFQPGDAEAVLDLSGMPPDVAMQRIEQLVLDPAPAGSYVIRFEGAADDGRETLFLPLGRRLLEARRDGTLSRCLPVADGAGYFIAFD